jgi:hypothetical protein
LMRPVCDDELTHMLRVSQANGRTFSPRVITRLWSTLVLVLVFPSPCFKGFDDVSRLLMTRINDDEECTSGVVDRNQDEGDSSRRGCVFDPGQRRFA